MNTQPSINAAETIGQSVERNENLT